MRISGERGSYVPVTKRFNGSGDVTVEWCFVRDGDTGLGDNAGYLDNMFIRAPYRIGFNPPVLTLAERQTTEVAVIITPTPTERIMLTLTASSTTQLSLSSTQVTIPQGLTSTSITITATEDDMQEGEQNYVVTIAAGDDVFLSETPSSLIVTIPASDLPVLTAQLDLSTINEGGPALLTFTTIDIPLTPTTITLMTQGSITVSSTEIILQGKKTTALVTADNDNTVMIPQRAATITLSVATDSVDLQTTQLTIIIIEDDPYQIGFIPSHITLEEGSTMTVTITATPPPLQEITLLLASQNTQQLTISPNDITLPTNMSSRQVTISVPNDNRPDQRQTYQINAAVTNNALASISTQLTVTIPANDTPKISFSTAAVSTLEEESVAITIDISPPPIEPVQATIDFQAGTLMANRIASPSFPTTFTIAAGTPSTRITITPLDDQIEQPDQSATLTLTLDSGFAQTGTPNHLTLTVDASDQPNSITILPTEPTLIEGTTHALTLTANSIKPSGYYHFNKYR